MEANEYDTDNLTVAQKKLFDEYESRIKDATKALQQEAPKHIVELGVIIRKSVDNESLVELERFLVEHNITVPNGDLEAFRDHLIVHRIDLKSLEPEARARMFARAHARENPLNMTDDFRIAMNKGVAPKCRNCRWFVTAPVDSDCNEEKSCVEMGTKGADTACYGFKYPSN